MEMHGRNCCHIFHMDASKMGCRGASIFECNGYGLHKSFHMLQQRTQRELSLHSHAANPTLLSRQSTVTPLSCSVSHPVQGKALICA